MLNKLLGKSGEDIACEFLKNQKMKIVARNYRDRFGEIDIICLDDDSYVFVEVKTRSSLAFGYPREAINSKKIFAIKNVAISYLKKIKKFDNVSARFDCVEILFNEKEYQINHLKNIF